MKVLFNDFANDPIELREAQARAAKEVIDSGWYVLGPKVEQFESAWAQYCGVAGCVGVANGMDALEIILRCRNIGPGDEVITTGMTAFATVLAIMRVGATPVFADIDPDTALLDLVSAEAMITSKTRAIILVHLYGQMKHMRAWKALCDLKGIDLIEDCAQAHGAKEEGIGAGAWGVAGAYSFYPTKNLGCVGDGGAVVSNDRDLIIKAKQIRNYGQENRYEHVEFGLNSRLDEIQAAILLERLPYLDGNNHKRRAAASTYFKILGERHTTQHEAAFEALAPPSETGTHVYHLFVGRTKMRDAFASRMKAKEIQVLFHYPIPCYSQLPVCTANVGRLSLPNTDLLAAEAVSLPCHPNLTEHELMKAALAVI
jgi:dTDP-4-amino-4,6-dideoxygalactose transaminase